MQLYPYSCYFDILIDTCLCIYLAPINRICIYIYTHTYIVYAYIRVYMNLYIYIYVHIRIHRVYTLPYSYFFLYIIYRQIHIHGFQSLANPAVSIDPGDLVADSCADVGGSALNIHWMGKSPVRKTTIDHVKVMEDKKKHLG